MLSSLSNSDRPVFGSGFSNMTFTNLVNEHGEQVAAMLNRYTACPATAAEIKQKVFIRAYEKLADYRGESGFGTWLYTIVRSVALDHLNQSKRRDENRSRYTSHLPSSGFPDQMMSQMDAASVRAAIQTLPKADAMLLDLHYFQQKDIQEIAVLLNCTPSHIRTKLSRARSRARSGLQRYFGWELAELCPGWNRKEIPSA